MEGDSRDREQTLHRWRAACWRCAGEVVQASGARELVSMGFAERAKQGCFARSLQGRIYGDWQDAC